MAKKKRGYGEGSIYRRKNRKWRAQISLDGKRHCKSFIEKADAKRWLLRVKNPIAMGKDIEGGKVTLERYLLEWLSSSNAHLRKSTLHDYGRTVERHIIPSLGQIRLMDLRLSSIERLYATLVTSGLNPRTVKFVHSVLHVALKKAVRYNLIPPILQQERPCPATDRLR